MGKSTLAKLASDRTIVHTDDYREHLWSEIPLRIIADLSEVPVFCLEGVQVARTLRKGLVVDAVVYLQRPKISDRLSGQIAMAKGVRTVFDEWHAANQHVPVFFESERS